MAAPPGALDNINDALLPVYFYARVLLNTACALALIPLSAETIFTHDMWRVQYGLFFSSVSAVLILLVFKYARAGKGHALFVWLVSFEFLAPCVLIGAGMQQLNTFTTLEYTLFWCVVIAPDALFVLLPRSLAGVAAFYEDDGAVHAQALTVQCS
mgnify:CR=1 FL=1|tara:strand:+ start:1480 stop:1944 length:465 start_codon:yes stop_codon:yes gene_type:complete